MMRGDRPIDQELDHLRGRLLHMASLVERAIAQALTSLVKPDTELARRTIEADREVDQLEVEIEEECIRLLALRQPLAGDLRFISRALKITTDLERIGDLAVNICERALELAEEPPLKPYIDIPRMAEMAQSMVRRALEAFVQKDAELALQVCRDDQMVDNLEEQVFRELLTFMIEDPRTVTRAMRISFVSKYLERIADHATNVAENVVYIVEAKDIRHGAYEEPKDEAQG